VRWSEGLAILPLAGVALAREGGVRARLALAAGFAGGVLLFVGVFDWLTWGAPFASLRAFVAFLPAAREAYTKRPPWWYAGWCCSGRPDPGPPRPVRRPRPPRAGAAPLRPRVRGAALPTSLKGMRYVMFAVLLIAVAAAFGWRG
jgi:hypothetical protein